MTRFFVRAAVVLMVLFTVVLVLIRAQPYDDSQAQSLHNLIWECSQPCLIGIHPYETSVDDAIEKLRLSGWVRDFRLLQSGMFVWDWTDKQPDWITDNDTDDAGQLGVSKDSVRGIVLRTDISLMDVFLALGFPSRVMIQSERGYGSYYGFYESLGITVGGIYECSIGTDPFRIRVNTIALLSSEDVAGYPDVSWREFYKICQ